MRRAPGVSSARSIQLRPLIGNSAICSGSMLAPITDAVVSISGASPVTVTVSSSVAGARTNSVSRISPRSKFTPVRVTV